MKKFVYIALALAILLAGCASAPGAGEAADDDTADATSSATGEWQE
jgi:predicted small secreted protein